MRALVSVYDKTGLVPFIRRLVANGYEIVSSGGTATVLEESGVEVARVSDVTGAPEILGGRVKTLHPKIHGGILARGEEDLAELSAHGIDHFDLVVCNLYPFRQTAADQDATEIEIIEKIDIGGPAMVRAAAKNYHHVGVVVSPNQYDEVADAIEGGGLSDDLKRRLAAEAFFHTASYDAAIVGWIGVDRVIPLRQVAELRYGENPQQEAWLYAEDGAASWWAVATQHQGKEMSFNNYADADAAWRLAADLGPGSVVIVKHTNACGAASGDPMVEVFERAWECDPLSAFGSVIGIHGILDVATAEAVGDRFVEVIVALGAEPEALERLSGKPNLRIITAPLPITEGVEVRTVQGGLLVQQVDTDETDGWTVVSNRPPTPAEQDALRFAWIVVSHTKSNAIVVANGPVAVGVGAGDQSRVGAAQRALVRAGPRSEGAVAASDAFFPFRDGLDALSAAGVTAVVEPGGSRNDQEVIDAANERGVALVFTGVRHFKH
jgi:phosphoribosylaminoimidazolecarboxamide formyltransferase/IMP cyclohydrolase